MQLFRSSLALTLLSIPALAQERAWVRQVGSNMLDSSSVALSGGAGGCFQGGTTHGDLFGPSHGGIDAWYARIDAAGSVSWSVQTGTNTADTLTGMAEDGAGGFYVCGLTDGDFAGTGGGGADLWVAHCDASGNPVWIRQAGGAGTLAPGAAAADGNGGVYAVGTGAFLGATGSGPSWLVHYDGSGALLSAQQFNVSSLFDPSAYMNVDFGSSVLAADGAGGVWAGGKYLVDPTLMWSDDEYYVADLVHFTSAGLQDQTSGLPGSSTTALLSDGSGGVYFATVLSGFGYSDAYAGRVAGSNSWFGYISSSSGAYALAADGLGGVYVGGSTSASFAAQNEGGTDAYVRRYDASGTVLWTRQLGSAGNEGVVALAGDGASAVIACGITFGNLGAPSAGSSDVWWARFDSPLQFASVCDPGSPGMPVCPCANAPVSQGRGCNNSSASGGAQLTAGGSASLANDSLRFTTSGEGATATSVLLQGDNVLQAGVVFGQGVSCVAGNLKRLYTKHAVGGGILAPDAGAGDPSISARSAALGDPLAAGAVRVYTVFYRDPVVLGGCSAASTFNTTQAGRIDWAQ